MLSLLRRLFGRTTNGLPSDVHGVCPVCGSESLCLLMSPCGEGF